MQGPRRKWRPRMVLLTLLFGMAAAAHIAALPVVALLGLALMLWVAEGHRSQALPVVLMAAAGALVLLFACYGFSPDAFSYVFRSAAGSFGFPWIPHGDSSARWAMPALRWLRAQHWRFILDSGGRATSVTQLRCFVFWF